MLTSGLRSYVLFEPGVIASDVPAFQAPAYQKLEPVGGVSLVLGGGNVASIPAMDALHKLFVDGHVVLLKMSPVNAYLGPLVERAFGPFVEAGFLRVVYGGADVGAYLCSHPALTDVHVTGSEATHDRIVWGPPGPERDERKRAGRPVFNNRLTSELGNVSPVVVVPFLYAHDELWFQARSVASQVINNASFNCNAAKIVVVSSKWPQRDLFLEMVAQALAAAPTRFAYYPGAHDRYGRLVQGRARVVCIGEAPPGTLPWTLVPDLDPRDAAEPLFRTESFCALFGEVSLPAGDPAHFVADAVRFCNERLWGTLNAAMIVPPVLEEDPVFGVVIERAIAELRYGTVAINTWPAVAYASAIAPWGGHASSTLADVQSGIGFVHNTLMLERIDKTVVRAPLRMFPKPPFFSENRRMDAVGRRLTEFAARPTWAGALSVARTALRG